jgi:hypothetical protein
MGRVLVCKRCGTMEPLPEKPPPPPAPLLPQTLERSSSPAVVRF